MSGGYNDQYEASAAERKADPGRRRQTAIRVAVVAVASVLALVIGIVLQAHKAEAQTLTPAAASKVQSASAGTSFAWSFSGQCCINSRAWTTSKQADITITSAVLPCERGQQYRILLERKKMLGWTSSGNWRYFHCVGVATWDDRKISTYRFRLEVAETVDSPQRDGYGRVYYDGGQP